MRSGVAAPARWPHRFRPVRIVQGLTALVALLAANAPAVTETFDSYSNATVLTTIGGGSVWTVGSGYAVIASGGVGGSNGIGSSNTIFNWKGQGFTWSSLVVGAKLAMAMDFQTSDTGKFDDDRVGWTITPDASTSTGSQLALQLDNSQEGGMILYHNLTRTPALNALNGIKVSTWYRFNVEFTKLTATSAGIVGTLTELNASGNPTGTPYVGTIADTSTFANAPSTALFGGSQCPSFKNYNAVGGNADNPSFIITLPGPQAPTVAITSPANNATVGTSFTIEATAADSDGTIASVSFYNGASLLGTDTTSPYSFAWTGAAVGSHVLTATATDNSGLATTSAPVSVTVSSNVAPAAPVVVAPANGATGVSTNSTLSVSVSDPNGDPMAVTFYGRSTSAIPPGSDFTVAVLPDTQFYAESYPAIFTSQTQWIVDNRVARSIAYVTGEGDVVNVPNTAQYANAKTSYDILHASGIPYGVPAGNHDSYDSPSYTMFATVFNPARFSGKSYYGGSYSTGYRNHYDLFTAGGMDFIVLSLEYNAGADSGIMTWANSLLQTNSNRRAIVVSHSLLQAGSNWPTPAAWSTDGGTALFPALSGNPNLFLMLCGHNHGQGRRHEAVGGRYIDVLLADWQSDTNGGNGFLRMLEFSPANNIIHVKTYSPYTLGSKTDGDNQFDLSYTMTAPPPFVALGTNTNVASGSQTSVTWSNLTRGVTYEWYATASDGAVVTSGTSSTFTTQAANQPPTVAITSPTTNSSVGPNFAINATAADSDGTVAKVEFYDGSTLLGSDTISPYSYVWTGASLGSHVLSAVATDNSGATTTSAVVNVTISPQRAQYVIFISADGLGGTYLGKLFDGTAIGGPYAIPNFTRLKNEGAGTLAAHCDNDNWETLPNHTSIITARPRDGANGHNWSFNGDPAAGQTIHSNNNGSYVAGVFDVTHDNGLRTGMYANKSKFSLFDTYGSYTGGGSYNATYGALDVTGPDDGRDKIDNPYINTNLGGIVVDTFIAQQKSGSPNHYAFIHINETDYYGHNGGWGSATWNNAAVTVDTMLGKIFNLIEQDVPAMKGKTFIILTADHGNQDNPPTGIDRYSVPFFVWGPGVPAGADLYALNPSTRQVAASYPMTTYGGIQPVRNAEASNLALSLLGLPAIPGSTFNFTQNLVVTVPSVTLGLTGSPLAETGGVATVTATLSAAHSQTVTVSLAFAGTATLASDYTRSATSIVIPAGSISGSITLTAVPDALVENPAETIVVDIASVVNGTENGTQQVSATITDALTATFAVWIHSKYPALTSPRDRPDADPDGDGLDNAIEYVLGSQPDAANGGGPTAACDGGDFVFNFRRAVVSKASGTAVTIDVGSTLDAWPTTYQVGSDSGSSSAGVTVGPAIDGYEAITLRVPRATAKMFVRLRVTIAL